MLNIKSFTNSISKELFFRFPLVFIFMILCFFFAVFENNQIYLLEQKLQGKLFLSSFILIGFTLTTYLYLERKNLDKIKKISFFLVSLLIVYLGVFTYEDSLLYLIFAAYLSITFSNFSNIKNSNYSILSFNMQVTNSVVFAFFSSFILGIGIKVILLTLKYLFSLTFFDLISDEMMIFISIIIFPTLVLANIPKNIEPLKNSLKLKKAVELLIKNILTPLILIYTIILYAYFIKIIIIQELPKGDLSWMICIFLSLSILVKAFLKSIKEQSIFTNFIDKYFIYLMIAPIIFLDIAIYIRVSEYGVTQLRYCLIILSIWFSFLIVLEFIKKQFCIKSSLVSMFLLLLVASITPLSSSNISLNSQFNRFKIVIEKYEVSNDKTKYNLKDLSLKKRVELTSIISYLSRSKKGMQFLNEFFNKNFKTKFEVFKYINMKEAYSYNLKREKSKYVQEFNLYNLAYDSKGYDYVLNLASSNNNEKEYKLDDAKLKIVLKDSILNLKIDNNTISFDLKEIVKNWAKKNIKKIDNSNYKETIFIRKNKNIEYKLNIQSLSINEKEDNIKVDYINSILMIRR